MTHRTLCGPEDIPQKGGDEGELFQRLYSLEREKDRGRDSKRKLQARREHSASSAPSAPYSTASSAGRRGHVVLAPLRGRKKSAQLSSGS